MTKNPYCFLIALCFGAAVLAAPPCYSQEVAVKNVTFSVQDSNVVVHYNLNGPKNKTYKVALVLRKQGDPNFSFRPVFVTGDVGEGKYSGDDRRIVWHLYQDMPDGLYGNDYYFAVTATLQGGGGIPWFYYVGGAVLLGGAAAAILNKPGSNGQNGTVPFPTPPGRPY